MLPEEDTVMKKSYFSESKTMNEGINKETG